MDIASVIGFVLAFGLMAFSIVVGGGSFSSFFDLPSVLVVVGGCGAAVMMCFPMNVVLKAPKQFLKVFLNKSPNAPELISQLVSLAETARRDGLLALEARLDEIQHPFIKSGIQMAIDGSRPEVIEDVLKTEAGAINGRHKDAKNVIDQVGKYAPAFGMIGTLMGLIMMLSNMSDPSSIGAGMAVALITTLYGAVISNAMFLPFAEKLGYYNKQEMYALEIIIRGILAIQSGENPRLIEQKLNTFLHPKLRVAKKAA